jgi:tetratricopeptide (TPR) repeat protein
MAKTKEQKKANGDKKSVLNRTTPAPSGKALGSPNSAQLVQQARDKLFEGDIEGAVPLAQRALGALDVESVEALSTLNLLGEIHVELGDIEAARAYFSAAVNIDSSGEIPEEQGGGAEKFMWLAQLSDEGGRDSVDWFERGAEVLRFQIQKLVDRVQAKGGKMDAEVEELAQDVDAKRRKLAEALCAIVEVYMTDLSWEEDAEAQCESRVTEATMVGSGFAEPWQTLASVRLSQERIEDAQAALKRSLDVWKDAEPTDDIVPDFPTRVSLARLLMEAQMEEETIEVLERLVSEDDSSVEVWYLGGWGLYIMGEKELEKNKDGELHKVYWISSRQWLYHCRKIFAQQEYEDERLGEHVKELISKLDDALGGPLKEGEEVDDDEESGDDEDEEMGGV